MILGDYNVSLNFARDTSNYLTDPHKQSRIKINQWIYNGSLSMFLMNCILASHRTHGQDPQISSVRMVILILGMLPWVNKVVLIIY